MLRTWAGRWPKVSPPIQILAPAWFLALSVNTPGRTHDQVVDVAASHNHRESVEIAPARGALGQLGEPSRNLLLTIGCGRPRPFIAATDAASLRTLKYGFVLHLNLNACERRRTHAALANRG